MMYFFGYFVLLIAVAVLLYGIALIFHLQFLAGVGVFVGAFIIGIIGKVIVECNA